MHLANYDTIEKPGDGFVYFPKRAGEDIIEQIIFFHEMMAACEFFLEEKRFNRKWRDAMEEIRCGSNRFLVREFMHALWRHKTTGEYFCPPVCKRRVRVYGRRSRRIKKQ